ncbi:hypothetical protein HA38_08875 [Pantoea allii]|nr:hypothetical protein HA38_08875 [Pantoea allii]PBJ98555.1 hypothetical protein CMR03_17740 [Pantoea allii]
MPLENATLLIIAPADFRLLSTAQTQAAVAFVDGTASAWPNRRLINRPMPEIVREYKGVF